MKRENDIRLNGKWGHAAPGGILPPHPLALKEMKVVTIKIDILSCFIHDSMPGSIFMQMVEKDNKYPTRLGQSWTDEETVKLLSSIQKKKTIGEIATEHERTTGGITGKLRSLAADYHFNDKRPIEEIQKFTGLSKEQIEFEIKRREKRKKHTEIPVESTQTPVDLANIMFILNDIQTKVNKLLERSQ
jgi:hypothetical protein